MYTFKEFLAEMETDEPMVVDPTFVEKHPELQQARKGAASPAGQKRFQQMYKRKVMQDKDQRTKQKMMQRAADKATNRSQQEVGRVQ